MRVSDSLVQKYFRVTVEDVEHKDGSTCITLTTGLITLGVRPEENIATCRFFIELNSREYFSMSFFIETSTENSRNGTDCIGELDFGCTNFPDNLTTDEERLRFVAQKYHQIVTNMFSHRVIKEEECFK